MLETKLVMQPELNRFHTRPRTAERHLKILRAATGARDLHEAASRAGVSAATVSRAMRTFGFKRIAQIATLDGQRELDDAEYKLEMTPMLSARDYEIVERYNTTSLSLRAIGRSFGVTGQRVDEILREALQRGVWVGMRPPRRGHKIEECHICDEILKLQRADPLRTRKQIAEALGLSRWKLDQHYRKLKADGLIRREFGFFRSERLINAIKCYQDSGLSTYKVGARFGYANGGAIFAYIKKLGLGYLLERKVHGR